MAEFCHILGGQIKVCNSTKPCITRDGRMTFVIIIGLKGLGTVYYVRMCNEITQLNKTLGKH